VGAAENDRAQKLIADAATVLQQAVEARIERHRDQFNKAYGSPEEVKRVKAQAVGGKLTLPGQFGSYLGDSTHHEKCPACGCDGLVSAEAWDEEEGALLEDSLIQIVIVHYRALAFRCGVCQLKLTGRDELELAGMETEFDGEEEREVEYEDPYLNE
jgi:hypothetical protein